MVKPRTAEITSRWEENVSISVNIVSISIYVEIGSFAFMSIVLYLIYDITIYLFAVVDGGPYPIAVVD